MSAMMPASAIPAKLKGFSFLVTSSLDALTASYNCSCPTYELATPVITTPKCLNLHVGSGGSRECRKSKESRRGPNLSCRLGAKTQEFPEVVVFFLKFRWVPVIVRSKVFLGLTWGPPIYGNCHVLKNPKVIRPT